ncbi:MAG: pirin family protein [Kiloniellales bacterium]
MIEHRPFESLGRFENDWLSARYHFSFAGYDDPARRGLGKLLVWNDDTIEPRRGFAPHGHRDMEIITYVREGAITHQDSLGNAGRTEAGDVQVMWAGSGILHSEMNVESEETKIFQIWIETAEPGIAPGWAASEFPKDNRSGELVVLASGAGDEGALPIHQDARILAATLKPGQSVTYRPQPGKSAYLVPAIGQVKVQSEDTSFSAKARDGVAMADVEAVELTAEDHSEILIAEVPA